MEFKLEPRRTHTGIQLMLLGEELKVRFREKLTGDDRRSSGHDWLLSYAGKSIVIPKKFKPDVRLLKLHRKLPLGDSNQWRTEQS